MRLLMTAALLIACCLPVLADWDPGDGHKMHWPQTPKPNGVDVAFRHFDTEIFWPLGDDWECSESGLVTDIHFWISYHWDDVVPIPWFCVSIWSNNPMGPYGYSEPLDMLWEYCFYEGEFTVRPLEPDEQGWYDPFEGFYEPFNHESWAQINIVDIQTPFYQEAGEIYWLVIVFPDLSTWPVGWKESDMNWNDDAVWLDPIDYYWRELYNPETGETLDLAFVITGEEPTSSMDSSWSRIKQLY